MSTCRTCMTAERFSGAGIGRRNFLKTVGLGLAALAAPGCAVTAGGRKKRPNIIFILADDLGWRDTGFTGSAYYETPHLDRFARDGMTFTSAYANAPNCAPTRACLLSGQYTPRHGIYTVNSSERGDERLRRLIPVPNTRTLDPGVVTIAEALRSAGYATASIGKWHLGVDPETGPLGQGFDVNIGGNRSGHPGSYFSPYKNKHLADGPEGEYLTDRLIEEALAFIEEHRESPFFLYLPHFAVHTPIQAREEMAAKYETKNPDGGQDNAEYAAMIESLDRGVGRIVRKIGELGLDGNTAIFFFSDNGGHGKITSNAPLRGCKGMLYEGGIRVPLAVRWPGRVRPGSACDVPVIGIDFYPTLLAMAGAAVPEATILDGESLAPLLEGKGGLEREAVFWHFPAYLEAYDKSKGPWRTTPAGVVRKGNWKLLEFFENGRLELYNLKDDIGETNDLAGSMPEKAAELHRLLLAWRRSVDAPVPSEKNPLYDPGHEPEKK